MATDEYNFNFNQFTKPSPGGSAGGVAGKAGSSSSADSAMLTKLAKLITQLYKEQGKQTAKSIEAAAAKMLRSALSSASGGMDKAALNKLVKDMSKEVADGVSKGMLKSVSGAVSKSSPGIGSGGIDETKLSKNIASGIDKSVDRQSKLLAAELRKRTGVSIDEGALARALSGAVKNAFPKSTETALKDFTQAASSLKNLGRDINRLVQAIGSMRKSGGGIDVSEFGPVLSSLKVLFKDLDQLGAESKKAKQSLKILGDESKTTVKQLTKAIDDFKRSAGRTVTGVKQRAADDPAKFRREMISTISKLVDKSPTLKNTEVGKAIKALEGNKGDINKLTKEISKLYNMLSKQSKSGKVKIEGIEEILRGFADISRNIGSVPKQFGTNAPKDWEQSAKKMETVLNRFANLSQELKIIVDDKELSKLEKFIKMGPITIDVGLETKTIYNDVVNAVKSAINEASKTNVKTTMEIMPIARDVVIAVETGDLDKSIATLEKLASKFPSTLKTSTPQVEAARERVSGLKASAGSSWYATKGPAEYEKAIKKMEEKSGSLDKLKKTIDKASKDIDSSDLGKNLKDAADSAGGLNQTLRGSARDAAAFKRIVPIVNELEKGIQLIADQAKRGALTPAKSKGDLSKIALTRMDDDRAAISRHRDLGIFERKLITPGMTDIGGKMPSVKGEAKKIRMEVNKNIADLSKSLEELQTTIIKELEKTWSEAKNGWDIVKPSKNAEVGEIFKAVGGRTGGRQWKADITDVKYLKRTLAKDAPKGSSSEALLERYISEFSKNELGNKKGIDDIASTIGDWLKTVTDAQIGSTKNLELYVARLQKIRQTYAKQGPDVPKAMIDEIIKKLGSDDAVEDVFRKTVGESKARRQLTDAKKLRTVTIPAAKTTVTGGTAFETQHGAQRGLPKFATFKTGFESLYDILQTVQEGDNQARKDLAKKARDYAAGVRTVGVRPSREDRVETGEPLAKTMLADYASLEKQKVAKQYKRTAVSVGIKQSASTGVSADAFVKKMEAEIDKNIGKSGTEFVDAMEKAGLKAYDVVRSLDRIKFENVYDIYTKMLTAGKKGTSVLEKLAQTPSFDKYIREYEKAIGQLEGTLPLVEASRPRRGVHQEQVVNLRTQTSSAYGERSQNMQAPAQKQLIKNLNLRINEILIEAAKIDQGAATGELARQRRSELPQNIKTLSSLGVPESAAGNVEDYRAQAYNSTTKYLDKLNSTVIKMYADNLAELSPFGAEFQQAGRNISNVSNAMLGRDIIETPKLQTEREKGLVKSGRYGSQGYGYNVLAELRNTASTFEDQIVISGKLATALTEVTKKLVKPAPFGRREFDEEGNLTRPSPSASDISAGGLVNTADILEKDIEMVGKEFMKILGVPEEYEGRADAALISGVEKAMSVVRGAPVEVQTAKLAETFINYFGRKFTTRYGSKGVGVSPTGTAGEILEKYGDKNIKIDPSAGLGYAKMPKTMGKLASEILMKTMGEKESATLRKQLLASGNRFIIDMFKTGGKLGVTNAADAQKQRELFSKVNEALGGTLPATGTGVEGIKALKTLYAKEVGGDKFKQRPIDVRISSYGAAKRGLQTEALESIMSNVAGYGRTGTGKEVTMKTRLGQDAYESLLGKGKETGSLAKYSKALGYLPSETLTGKGGTDVKTSNLDKLKQQLKGRTTDSKKMALAERAAELEAISSYYTEIIDEMGTERRSLVGEKFLQIIEEPGKDPGWSKREVDKGIKGSKQNLLAFPAYATIFGEQSDLLKRMAQGSGIDTKKHYEYIKALQLLNAESQKAVDEMLKELDRIDISAIQPFTHSTGIRGMEASKTGRGLGGTVLDTGRYPGAFNLQLPTVKPGQERGYQRGPGGEVLSGRESFYVPGASARGTYPEKLIAGEEGMDVVSRRLTHITNMAKDIHDFMASPDKYYTDKDTSLEKKIAESVAMLTKEANIIANPKGENKKKPINVNRLEEIFNQLYAGLSDRTKEQGGGVDQDLIMGSIPKLGPLSERQYVESFRKEGDPKDIAYAISQASDILVGPNPERSKGKYKKRLRPDSTLKKIRTQGGDPNEFARDFLGIDVIQKEVDQKVDNLTRAKIEYYNTLAETTLGKSGSIQELLFTRKIPSVMAKATTAVVDRRSELKDFSKKLKSISKEYGVELGINFDTLANITTDHEEAIQKSLQSGIPVLKQHEIGIPENLAKKIPVKFPKAYKFDKEGEPFKAPGVSKHGKDLAELIQYKKDLNDSLEFADDKLREEIKKYSDEVLTPYVEAIRYPFTGVSSIQPFEAKILDKKGSQGLEQRSFSVPGVPEMDVQGFDNILEDLKMSAAKLSEQRESQQRGQDYAGVEKTTKALKALEAAISEATPKYVAHQMKLDFDGDEIQIHSAKTAEARKEIEKHYKALTDVNSALGTTAGRYRDKFTYEKLPSTGDNTIAEMMMAFDKKFGSGKGFEFLKSPFLTKDLEYLEPKEKLSVLSEAASSTGTPLTSIEGVLTELGKSSKEVAEVSKALSAVEVDENVVKYSNDLLMALDKLDSALGKKVIAGISNKLFEEKYQDVIEAQLFKIHTGTETEAMARLQRLGESTLGFGTGVMGFKSKKEEDQRFVKQYKPTEEFTSRYPKSIGGLGINMEEEFHTMLNEMFRFAIQKGMDVKHAGAKPIAGELVKYVSSGIGGAAKLWDTIKSDDAYSELKDLFEANKEAIMHNLGEQPTQVIRDVAGDIASARGMKDKVSDMDRNELTAFIVKAVGFEGFLRELSLMVKDAAIKGLIKQAQTWKPGAAPPIKTVTTFTGEVEKWAKEEVEAQMASQGGINIRDLVTRGENPLYGFRTKTANTYNQLKDYEAKYSGVTVPEEISSGLLDKKSSRDYIDKYKKTKATAVNIKEGLMKAGQTVGDQPGGYAQMVKRGFDDIENAQVEIQEIINSWKNQGYEQRSGGDYIDRLSNMLPTESDIVSGMTPENRTKELNRLITLTGAPKVSKEENRELQDTYAGPLANIMREKLSGQGIDETQIEAAAQKYAEDKLGKIEALAQLDRVYAVIKSKAGDTDFIKSLFAGAKGVDVTESIRASVESEAKMRARFVPPKRDIKGGVGTPMEKAEGGIPSGAGASMTPSGETVPVFIMGASPEFLSNFKNANVVMSTTPTEPEPSTYTRMAEKQAAQFGELERMMSILKSAGESGEGKGSFASLYSPSRLKGGGKYGAFTSDLDERYEDQIKEIMKTMTGKQKPMTDYNNALADIGTLIHEKLQQTTFDKPEFETEKILSIGGDKTFGAGEIVGFADVVESTKDKLGNEYVKKIIDIKTTGEDVVKSIEKLGTTDMQTILENVNDETKRKIEDAYSQINTYLKAIGSKLQDETRGEIQFYSREGKGNDTPAKVSFKYSPERFQRDMEAIKEARRRIINEGGLGTGVFKKLPSLEERKAQVRPEVSIDDVNNAIEYGISKARKIQKESASTYSKERDTIARGRNIDAIEREKAKISGIGADYNATLEPPPIAEGKGLLGVFENIRTLHEQAKLYQNKYHDISRKDFEAVRPEGTNEIEDALKQIDDSGPSGQEFLDKIKELQGIDALSGKDAWKAWRLYRIASGDYLIDQAAKAKERADEAFAGGDKAAGADATADFERHTKRLQEHIRRSVGKRTDIYTENRKFLYPGLAQAAGVYLNPKQITQRATDPLGEDKDLIKVFKNLTADLKQGADVIAPVEKVREALSSLTKVKPEVVAMLTSAEKFARMGDEVQKAWTFTGLSENITKLRAGLEGLTRFNMDDFGVVQQKNIRDMIKYLKSLENAYANASKADFGTSGAYGDTGIVKVPAFETPENQIAMHRENIQRARQFAATPEERGGQKIGEAFNYPEKIIGESGEVLKNVIHTFKKYGEEVTKTGDKVGKFSETQKDLIELMSRSNATFGSAIRRVVMWGAASRLIYGGISNLKASLDELSNIEMGIAQLRMVMSPLETDFMALQKAAVGFAKQYGVGVTDVLRSMKVFAQQGLSQTEVIDRTRTSTLAANVTTLDAKEATEALTAAMKSFREEGDSSLRFLDAWSEVEAKHAITAADMANAIKKSAAAARNAGFTFDELNGIVASIGAVTRQSGKEVGTAMRFIFRRIFSEKGPKELGKLNIPTLTDEGENRRGFDILNDLSMAWKDLTSAQKLNVAQALGGTRQYNALLVAMDNWDEALRGISNSTNSKGSSERRNIEIMKTYAKQMEQMKAAATELKLEFGKIVLPTFKAGLKSIKFLLEGISSIPTPIKAVVAALGGLFVFGAKGINIFDTLAETFSKGKSAFDSFSGQFGKQLDIAKFEVLGKRTRGLDTYNLKTIRPDIGADAEGKIAEKGKSFKDFQSVLGMTAYGLREVGAAYNDMLGKMAGGTGKGLENIGEKLEKLSLFSAGAGYGLKKTLPKILSRAAGAATSIGGEAAGALGHVTDFAGEKLGKGAEIWIKNFASENAGLVKTLLPLGITAIGIAKGFDVMKDSFIRTTKSASDFEKYMDKHRRKNEGDLKTIRELSMEYGRLSDQMDQINKATEPETKKRRQELGTYEAPLVTLQKVQKDATMLANKLAEENSALVLGYDKLGNAILKTTANFSGFLKEIDKLKVKEGVGKELDILSRFTEDLTKTDGSEKIKKAMKDLLESTPIFGDLLGKQIKISPAKLLEDASGRLNKLVNLKNQTPLSTAANKDIKELQKALSKARTVFNTTYADFDRVRKNILSKSTLKGLDKGEIEEILGSDTLKEAYKLQLEVDPKFKLAKGVTWQDIMGKELLSILYPKAAGAIDVNAQLTKANLETAGVRPRTIGTGGQTNAFSGDLVTFTDDAAKKYEMAGNQAILRYKETTDGIYEWIAEYFNTKTLKIEERTFGSELEQLTDQIFPLQAIQENVEERINSLNTFVAGAAAGLVGLSKKAFKKDFDLGARFFSGVPTTTILQGNKGYTPETGYGEIPFQKNWQKEIIDFYIDPMEELRMQMDRLSKLTTKGLKDTDLGESQFESIQKLLTILKNNQVVLQFKSVFVDLMKELSEGQRILKENLAVQKRRNELDRETSGLMAGTIKGLANLDTGISSTKDLNVKQRLVKDSPGYEKAVKLVQASQLTIESNLASLDKLEKAIVAINEIDATAGGFGAKLSKEELLKYVEKEQLNKTPQGKMLNLTQSIDRSTTDSASTLVDILANLGDSDALSKQWEKVSQYLGAGANKGEDSDIVKAMDRAVKIRGQLEKTGNQESVALVNDSIDKLINTLVDRRGIASAASLVGTQGIPFTTQIGKSEFLQRATGGADSEVLIDAIKKFAPNDTGGLLGFFKKSSFSQSKELSGLRDLQESDGKKSIINSRQIAKATAAAAAVSVYRKAQNTRIVRNLDKQIKQYDDRIKQGKESGKTEKELRDISKKRAAVITVRDESQKTADFYGMVTALSAITTGATELGMALGLTERQVKLMGLGAVGTYAAVKLASKVTGKDMPESAKKFGAAIKNATASYVETGTIDKSAISDAGKLGKEMAKELAKKSAAALGPTSAGIARNARELDVEGLEAAFEKGDPGDYENIVRSSFGKDIEKFAQRTASGVNVEESAKNIEAAIVGYAAATIAGVIAKQNEDKVRLATLSKRSEDQAEAWIKIAEKYPMAFQKAIEYLNQGVKDAENTAGKIETKDVPKAQDVDEYKKTIVGEIKGSIAAPIEEAVFSEIEKVKKAMEKISFAETIEGRIKEVEDLARGERQRRDDLSITSKYNPQAILNKSLSGFVEGPGAPLLEEQMSTQQRVYAGSDSVYRKSLTQYADVNQSVNAMIENMRNLKAHIRDATDVINSGVSPTAVATQEALLDSYNNQLKNQEAILKRTTEELRRFAQTKQALDAFSESTYRLKDALKDVGVEETVDALLTNYRGNMSNLFGGGGLMAPQMVTPREERDAARVGIRLTSMVSNQYDKMRADLMNRLEGADGMDAIRIRQDLRDLPELMRRQQEGEGQRTEIEALQRQLAPFEENMRMLARARNLPGMGDEQRTQIAQMMSTRSDLLDRATDVVSPQDLYAGLFRALEGGFITKQEFDTAKNRIDEAGPRQFRGVPFWIDRMLTQLKSSTIESALKAEPTLDMMEMKYAITDPITARIDLTNALLTKIAAEEFGMDVDELKALKDQTLDKIVAKKIEDKRAAQESVPVADTTKSPFKPAPSIEEAQKYLDSQKYKKPLKTPPSNFDVLPPLPKTTLPPSVGDLRTRFDEGYMQSSLLSGVRREREASEGVGVPYPMGAIPNLKVFDKSDIMGPPAPPYDPAKSYMPPTKSKGKKGTFKPPGSQGYEVIYTSDKKKKPHSYLGNLPSSVNIPPELLEELKRNRRASGGRIFGEGGPREDKVPAYLSPGEFVVRAASAQKIGYDNLETMNKKGAVPAFADGGRYLIDPKTGKALGHPDTATPGTISQGSKLDFLNPQRRIIQTPGDKAMNTGYDIMSLMLAGKVLPGALKAAPALFKELQRVYKAKRPEDILIKNTNKNTLKSSAALHGFADGGTYKINPKTGKSFYKPDVKKAMNPNLAGLLGAAGAIGKGAIDIDAWKELLGIGALQRIYEGEGGLLDYAEGAMMTFPAASAVGKLTAGSTKLATTTGKSLVKLFKGLDKTKKATKAAKVSDVVPDVAKELGLDMSMEGARTVKRGAVPDEIAKYMTGDSPQKMSKISPDKLINTEFEKVNTRQINEVLSRSKKIPKIPKFKSTNDAMAFGKTATPEQLAEVAKLQELKKAESAKLLAAKKYNEAMELATESQFYREVIEMSEGKLKVPGGLKTKPKAVVKPGIPKLKSTMDAIDFGKTASKEQLAEITKLKDIKQAEYKKLLASKNYNEAMTAATDAQFYRQAVEMSQGKLNVSKVMGAKSTASTSEIITSARFNEKLAANMGVPKDVGPTFVDLVKLATSGSDIAKGKINIENILDTLLSADPLIRPPFTDKLVDVVNDPKLGRIMADFEWMGPGRGLGYEAIVGRHAKDKGYVLRVSDMHVPEENLAKLNKSEYFNTAEQIEHAGGMQIIKSKELMRADEAAAILGDDKVKRDLIKMEAGLRKDNIAYTDPGRRNAGYVMDADGNPIGMPKIMDPGAVSPSGSASPLDEFFLKGSKKYQIKADPDVFTDISMADGGIVGWIKDLLKGYTLDPEKIKGAGIRDHYKELEEQMEELERGNNKFAGGMTEEEVRKLAKITDYKGDVIDPWSWDSMGLKTEGKERRKGFETLGFNVPKSSQEALEKEVAKVIETEKDTGPKFIGHTPNTKRDRLERPKFAQEAYKRDMYTSPYAIVSPTKSKKTQRDAISIATPTPPPEFNIPKQTEKDGIYSWVDDKGVTHFSDSSRFDSSTPDKKGPRHAELWGRTTGAAAIDAQKAYRPLPDRGILDGLLPEEYARAGEIPSFGLQAQYNTPLHGKMQEEKARGVKKIKDAAAKLQVDKEARVAIREIPANVDAMIKDLQGQLGTASNEEAREIRRKIETAQNFRKQSLSEFETDPNRNLIIGPNGKIAYQSLSNLKDAAYKYLIPEKYRGQTSAADKNYIKEQEKIKAKKEEANKMYAKDPGAAGIAATSGLYSATGQEIGLGADKTHAGQTLAMLDRIIAAGPDDEKFLEKVKHYRDQANYLVNSMSRGLPFNKRVEQEVSLARKLVATPFAQDLIQEEMAADTGLNSPWLAYFKNPALYKDYLKQLKMYGSDGSKWPENVPPKEQYLKILSGEDKSGVVKARKQAIEKSKLDGELDKKLSGVNKSDVEKLKELLKLQEVETKTASTMTPVSMSRAAAQVMQRQEEALKAFGFFGSEGGSLPVYHQGGEIRKTGPIFAQKGEVVLPKAFADGGLVEDSFMSQSMSPTSTTKVDYSGLAKELVAELESVELKVEDKEMKVEDKTFEVEDKTFEVADKEFTVNESTLTVVLDSSAAEASLASTLSNALSDIQVTANTAGVGGQELNQLSESIAQVSDRVFALSSDYNESKEEIKVIASKVGTDVNVEQLVKQAINDSMVTVNKEISDTNSNLDRIRSSVERQSQFYQQVISDLEYRLNNTMNITGTV